MSGTQFRTIFRYGAASSISVWKLLPLASIFFLISVASSADIPFSFMIFIASVTITMRFIPVASSTGTETCPLWGIASRNLFRYVGLISWMSFSTIIPAGTSPAWKALCVIFPSALMTFTYSTFLPQTGHMFFLVYIFHHSCCSILYISNTIYGRQVFKGFAI